ncbi:mandelate racemase/muconate lactonizing enzyme [Stereum hirsutum FP-91666 SS1]|uniref:mandelate racemase/muconate lactonizing enzyme n=1 Tax=Stereum hirsutum (strain FP-91666) TaxID=721885 RepID=UPI0004449B32|nr:mandelate racemase/muconate lactonizing enzyme [Stereum hirsutum FP-91666 SS1]EIM84643.1 mandelate racemase/muconate lactonizing enzyme [Stereum hirsutum FP-91666 SS1]
MTMITHFETHDVCFPTSLSGDGTDAMNTDCDYSAAYVTLYTSSSTLVGHGLTFTIGRGTDIVCSAIKEVASRLVNKEIEPLFANMGQAWEYLTADSQLRWIGPEKGVIHIATGAVDNALWDLYARAKKKPLWKLVVDFTPEELVNATTFRYITDALTPDEALEMLKAKEATKKVREEKVREVGYPAYVTSAGWMGYSDDKVSKLMKAAVARGFNHFKMKVGTNRLSDLRRGKLIRSIIDDPQYFPESRLVTDPGDSSLEGKNAGGTGSVIMMDANQVWDVGDAIEWTKGLAEIKPWFIEEPTAPDDILGHAAIRKALKPHGIGVATGEHAHNRMVFKQLFQADAIDVCQIDACRLAGVSEVLSVMLMAAKFGIPVCPHAGGVGLCEYAVHLCLIDYVAISGSMERNVLEFADHLHEHFVYPCSISEHGRYNVPTDPEGGYSVEMHTSSFEEFGYPDGSYWVETAKVKADQ